MAPKNINEYSKKARKQEIKEFEKRATIIQLLEDLGQRNVAMCDNELIYTLTFPKSSEEMAENLSNN